MRSLASSQLLFTDASLHPQTRTGFGAYILIPALQISVISLEKMKREVKIAQFSSASIAQLELASLLWALEENPKKGLTIFTDSQNIAGLTERREKLETSGMVSAATGKPLSNAEYYIRFFDLIDRLQFKVMKIRGHSKSAEKDPLEKIFTVVDRASRKALRTYLSDNEDKSSKSKNMY